MKGFDNHGRDIVEVRYQGALVKETAVVEVQTRMLRLIVDGLPIPEPVRLKTWGKS